MNRTIAIERLRAFMGDYSTLTFNVRTYPDGEWVAECNEIPAIITGGMNEDEIIRLEKMRDAIITAAGISEEYENILSLRGYQYNEPVSSLATYHALQPERDLQVS